MMGVFDVIFALVLPGLITCQSRYDSPPLQSVSKLLQTDPELYKYNTLVWSAGAAGHLSQNCKGFALMPTNEAFVSAPLNVFELTQAEKFLLISYQLARSMVELPPNYWGEITVMTLTGLPAEWQYKSNSIYVVNGKEVRVSDPIKTAECTVYKVDKFVYAPVPALQSKFEDDRGQEILRRKRANDPTTQERHVTSNKRHAVYGGSPSVRTNTPKLRSAPSDRRYGSYEYVVNPKPKESVSWGHNVYQYYYPADEPRLVRKYEERSDLFPAMIPGDAPHDDNETTFSDDFIVESRNDEPSKNLNHDMVDGFEKRIYDGGRDSSPLDTRSTDIAGNLVSHNERSSRMKKYDEAQGSENGFDFAGNLTPGINPGLTKAPFPTGVHDLSTGSRQAEHKHLSESAHDRIPPIYRGTGDVGAWNDTPLNGPGSGFEKRIYNGGRDSSPLDTRSTDIAGNLVSHNERSSRMKMYDEAPGSENGFDFAGNWTPGINPGLTKAPFSTGVHDLSTGFRQAEHEHMSNGRQPVPGGYFSNNETAQNRLTYFPNNLNYDENVLPPSGKARSRRLAASQQNTPWTTTSFDDNELGELKSEDDYISNKKHSDNNDSTISHRSNEARRLNTQFSMPINMKSSDAMEALEQIPDIANIHQVLKNDGFKRLLKKIKLMIFVPIRGALELQIPFINQNSYNKQFSSSLMNIFPLESQIARKVFDNHISLGRVISPLDVYDHEDRIISFPSRGGASKIVLDANYGTIYVNGTSRVINCYEVKNGFIYVIDRMLTPAYNIGPTVEGLIRADPSFSLAASLLGHKGVLGPFEGIGPLTFLLVADESFEACVDGQLPQCIRDSFKRSENQSAIQKLILHSVVDGVHKVEDMSTDTKLRPFYGPELTVTKTLTSSPSTWNLPSTYIDGKRIVRSNIALHNGIAHVLEGALHLEEVNMRGISYWSCLDEHLRLHPGQARIVLQRVDGGKDLPVLGTPPGERPAWVGVGLPLYFPPSQSIEVMKWRPIISSSQHRII